MIDNLDDAIQHCLHRAEENRAQAENYARGEDYEQIKGQECEECAKDHDQLASWLEELNKRRKTEPIVYEITEDSQGFVVETKDDRNIGLKKVSTHNLISAMRKITEKYWDEGLRVVFKYYCGNGDEWQKCYESEVENGSDN